MPPEKKQKMGVLPSAPPPPPTHVSSLPVQDLFSDLHVACNSNSSVAPYVRFDFKVELADAVASDLRDAAASKHGKANVSCPPPPKLNGLRRLLAAALHPLTAPAPARTVEMLDFIVSEYLRAFQLLPASDLPTTISKFLSFVSSSGDNSTAPHPCGYVFKTGDIAWNCRTCQSDPTCVLCSTCFRNSDHTGHQVFFHRTSPGGCCDCGDIEAWKAEGCCDKHRPLLTQSMQTDADVSDDASPGCRYVSSIDSELKEALKATSNSVSANSALAKSTFPTAARSILACLSAAIVRAIHESATAAGVASDLSQWMYKYAEEVCAIRTSSPYYPTELHPRFAKIYEKYSASEIRSALAQDPSPLVSPLDYLRPEEPENDKKDKTVVENDETGVAQDAGEPTSQTASQTASQATSQTASQATSSRSSPSQKSESPPLPKGYSLFVRIHNDDVHTYDEVTKALFDDGRGSTDDLLKAKEITARVDHDGQVIVDECVAFSEAIKMHKYFRAIHGLQTSVVSSPQLDAEERATVLASFLTELSSSSDAFSAMLIHALTSPVYNPPSFAEVSFETFPLPRKTNNGVDADPSSYPRIFLPKSIPYTTPPQSPHSLWEVDPDTFVVRDTDFRIQYDADIMTRCLAPFNLKNIELSDHNVAHYISKNLKEKFYDDLLFHVSTAEYQANIGRGANPHNCDFTSALTPVLAMLLHDPYPSKAFRFALHSLFLPLLVHSSFKNRLGASLAVAYKVRAIY